MNFKTTLVVGFMLLVGAGSIGASVAGLFLPENVDNTYVRQGVTSRSFIGGGTSFGK